MKKLALILLVTVLAFGFSSQAMAADGNVSDGVLADMGLSGLQTMTDAQGDQIRGKGFALVWGFSVSSTNGAGSSNTSGAGYLAVGDNFAAGATATASFSAPSSFSAGGGFSIAGSF